MVYNRAMEQTLKHITIQDEVITEQEIIKSKFITYLAPVEDEESAKEYLRHIKKIHPKATHHCSAYVVGEIERSNDDGEPASSAGLPMLQVLRGHELQNVIAVVVRYYGGTKLGVGGLIRAYGSSVTLGIEHAILLEPKMIHTAIISFPYEHINAVETLCDGICEIEERKYDALVHYTVKIENLEDLDDLDDFTQGSANLEVIEKTIAYVKKEVQDES